MTCASRILDERSSVERLPRKTSCGLRQQLVHAVATDLDVGRTPSALLIAGGGERASVVKNELCCMCGLCVEMKCRDARGGRADLPRGKGAAGLP